MHRIQLISLAVFAFVLQSNAQTTSTNKFLQVDFDTTITQFENSPVGFASVNAYGQNGTTGGAGGDTLLFTDTDALQTFFSSRKDDRNEKNLAPKVIIVQGTFLPATSFVNSFKGQFEIKNAYNLTLIGKGLNTLFDGIGLAIINSKNIIVRNIEFRNCKPDCITITTTSKYFSHHIWIDHCTFSDSPASDPNGSTHDGLLDITHRTNYVTISWNHFYNHNKTCLLGYTDGDTLEAGRLKTTYHHNWFDNTTQRHPRVRHAECHVFNNYYDGTQAGMQGYGIASTDSADVVVESDYFRNVKDPAHVSEGNSGPGDLLEKNNIYENCGTPQTQGNAFNPTFYYSYKKDDPAKIPAILTKYAGSGKFNFISTDVKEEYSIPNDFKLFQNYPNPFNPETVISWQLAVGSYVTLKVYDILGKEVAALVNKYQQAGTYSFQFSTYLLADKVRNLPSGVYFYQLKTGNFVETKKMMLLK